MQVYIIPGLESGTLTGGRVRDVLSSSDEYSGPETILRFRKQFGFRLVMTWFSYLVSPTFGLRVEQLEEEREV